jgi:hypothetical protein
MSILGSILSKVFGHEVPAARATASAPTAAPAAAPAAAPPPTVDVVALLDGLAAKNPQKLDWKHSIVDMMKLLDMDSSFAERKQLAQELGYTGDTADSATMNIWLHGQVMQKLAANGGKLPPELLK